MPERKPIKATWLKPETSYLDEDKDDAPNKKQFAARALLLLCLMFVAIGAAYDIGTKLAASPKVRHRQRHRQSTRTRHVSLTPRQSADVLWRTLDADESE